MKNALIASGADVNSADIAGNTPLICAAKFGHIECIKALLQNGANVNVENNGGITAMSIAKLKAQPEILRLLKVAGAQN